MAARRRKEEVEEHAEGVERWLLTYADMITLLMVLFIVLFSIGQLDLKKFEELREGLASSFGTETPVLSSDAGGAQGVLDGGVEVNGEGLDAEQLEEALDQALGTLAAQEGEIRESIEALQETQIQIEGSLDGAGLGDQVTYRLEARGLVLNIVSDQVLFDLGRADLRPEGREVLDGVATALQKIPNDISIEGHTDNRPLNGGFPYPTNWELSTGRATSVLRYFVERHLIDPARLKAAGYADQQPLVPNSNDANQSRNRRVEIVVIATPAETLERLQQQVAAQEESP